MPLDRSLSQDNDNIVKRPPPSVRKTAVTVQIDELRRCTMPAQTFPASESGPLQHYQGGGLSNRNDSPSCGSQRHEQGGIQADLRQPLDRKGDMYLSVRFLDKIGNIELKSVLRIKSLRP